MSRKPPIAEFFGPQRPAQRPKKWLLLSIAAHILAALLLAQIVFEVDFGGMPFVKRGPTTQERINYVRIAPTAPAGGGAGGSTGAPAEGTPPPMQAPRATPATVPAPEPDAKTGVPGGTAEGTGTGGGEGNGSGGAPNGAATGIVPSYGDPRLWGPPGSFVVVPKTPAQRVDSAIRAAFQVYVDSLAVAEATRGRDPDDWTFKRGEEKWGVDRKWIHLGKFRIPTAVLAALPINVAANPAYTGPEGRQRSYIRQDILFHANRVVREDEFREAVKRIRERKDREREEERQRREQVRPE